MSARRTTDDRGFTLVELLVAMVITGMVLTMAGSFFVNVTRAAAVAKSDRVAMAQVALAVDAVRNTVSMASDNPTSLSATTPAIVSGTASALSVISYANTVASSVAPSQYSYSLDSSSYLVETRATGVLAGTGYWTFTGGTTTTRRIGGPYLSGSKPFFSYIDKAGAQIVIGSGSLASTDLGKVAFVRITAQASRIGRNGATAPVTATTTIGLTNVYRDVAATVTLPAVS